MSTFTEVTMGRGLPFVVLLLSLLMMAPEVTAQSRQRGRTTRAKTSRVERGDKETKVKREGRKKETTRTTARTRSKTRTRSTQTSRQRTETRSRSTQNSRTTMRDRSRQSRDTKVETRPRATRNSGEQTRTRTRSSQTERGSSKARSGQRGNQAERDRGAVRNRGGTRGNRDTQTRRQRSRTDEVEISRGRAERTETRGKTRQSRTDNRGTVERGGRSSGTRAERGASTSKQRTDRQSRRRDVKRRREVRYTERDRWRNRYERNRRYDRKHYKRRYYKKKKYYYKPVVRPFIHIDIHWPWEHRYRHGWRPRYQYRQVIYVDAGWGSNYRRRSQIDVRTSYYHELRHASRNKAEVDIYIERIEFYENGRYLGEVHDIPKRLGRIRATVYRDGYVKFDRNVFIVGDSYSGFEMISTRYYDGFLLNSYRPSHGMRVGVVDLYRGRVVSSSYSRCFDLNNFDGYVPVSLLPDEHGWLLDYGNASYSANYYDYDPYYYGGYSNYDDAYDDPYYGDDYYEEDYYVDENQRPHYSVRSTVAEANFDVAAQTRTHNRSYQTAFGANINLKRETEFVRVK